MTQASRDMLKQSTILQLYARAAAPCRDYYILSIGESYVCLNSWKITHGPHATPKEKMTTLKDLQCDKYFQEEIKNIFGGSVFDYIQYLTCKVRRLENLPTKLFLHVLKFVNLNDILRLSYTSRIFFELSNTEEVWKLIFFKKLRRKPSPEETRMAIDTGYKEVLRKRLVYILKAFKEKEAALKNKSDVTPAKTVASIIANKKKMIGTK